MSIFGCCCRDYPGGEHEIGINGRRETLAGLNDLDFAAGAETPRKSEADRDVAREQMKNVVKQFASTAAKEGYYIKCASVSSDTVPEVVTLRLDRLLEWISLTPAPLFLRRVPHDLSTGALRLYLLDIASVQRGGDWLATTDELSEPMKARVRDSVVLRLAPRHEGEEEETLLLVVEDDKERRRLYASLKVIR